MCVCHQAVQFDTSGQPIAPFTTVTKDKKNIKKTLPAELYPEAVFQQWTTQTAVSSAAAL